MWSRYADSAPFEPGSPWLLRFFDRISWYPVSPEELLDLRADMAAGRGRGVEIEDGTFSLADHEDFLARNSESIGVFREQQAAAFAVERQAWADAGEFDRADAAAAVVPASEELVVPDGATLVAAPFAASVWKVDVTVGDRVVQGQPLVSLEAMKMETVLAAPCDGVVHQVLPVAGSQVVGGEALVVLGLPCPHPLPTPIAAGANRSEMNDRKERYDAQRQALVVQADHGVRPACRSGRAAGRHPGRAAALLVAAARGCHLQPGSVNTGSRGRCGMTRQCTCATGRGRLQAAQRR